MTHFNFQWMALLFTSTGLKKTPPRKMPGKPKSKGQNEKKCQTKVILCQKKCQTNEKNVKRHPCFRFFLCLLMFF